MGKIVDKKIKLKDGRSILLRTPKKEDAAKLLEAILEITKFSPYILSAFDEMKLKTIEEEERFILSRLENPRSLLIVAEHDGKIVGITDIVGFKSIKMKHRAGLGISLLPDFRGAGLGKILMSEIIHFARSLEGIKLIELDVMAQNERAIGLYKSLGFKEVARIPNAYLVGDDQYDDSIRMTLE